MGFKDSEVGGGLDDAKINSNYFKLLDHNKQSAKCDDDRISSSTANLKPGSTSGEDMMDFTAMIEAMDAIIANTNSDTLNNNDIGDENIDNDTEDTSDLLAKLDQIFTPVLIVQKMEQNISDESNQEIAEAGVLSEKTMISFDDPDRMAQLQSVCALLIAQKKNTQNWQMFKKAAVLKNQSKLNIQKEEYDAAKNLAQQYLIKVSTTNNSSVARDAAKELLPQTQH